MPAASDTYEYFWVGYLTHLVDEGVVTMDTPPSLILEMKADFMAGIRGGRPDL